jgi:putative salt-induced outer membrane protein
VWRGFGGMRVSKEEEKATDPQGACDALAKRLGKLADRAACALSLATRNFIVMHFDSKARSRAAVAIAVLGGVWTPVALAEWAGKAEGGLVLSRGNSDSTSVNAKLDLARVDGDWKNILNFAGLYGSNATFATSQRLEGRWELDRKISDRMFGFVGLRGERDLFSGFDYQATASTGLGYKFIDSATTKLSGTLGVGYRRLRPETLIKAPSGQVLNRIKGTATGDAVGTAGLAFEHQVTKTTKLFDKLLIESGSRNTSVANDFGVQVSMTDALALSFGYGIRYNTDPSPGSKRTDQLTTVNIVYNIK